MPTRRELVLAGVLVAVLALAAVVLLDVLATVFFAITIAYVLVPARKLLVDRGLSGRVASAIVTTGAFAAVTTVVGAFGIALYLRRQSLFALLATIPAQVVVPLGPVTYVVDTGPLLDTAVAYLQALALTIAQQAPVILLKLVVFAFVLFALLVRPDAPRDVVVEVVPLEYHDVVDALDDRVHDTLNGIYVLQAATAAGTFVVALVVFWALGYDSVFTLALIAAAFQFVPVIGPSVLVVALAAFDILEGMPSRGLLVLVFGGLLVAAAPDAIIRPRLARWAADLPTSLYFIGFVGGILTVGAVGFIAGPLVIAVLVEVVNLLAAAERDHHGDHASEFR